jgi:colanic acid/amylovoran biosynthesis protein WcaK/AmsJ
MHCNPHIVVDGLYGIQSYGDDAMLLSLVRNLPERIPQAQFTVLCRHPKELTARYDIAAIRNLDHPEWVQARGYWFYGFNDNQPTDHIDQIRETIAAADLLVIGGGNLLLDITDDWLRGPIAWHWFSSEIARIYQVPYMIFANSVGPFRTQWGRARSAHILRNAAAITLRDEESFRLLQEMGIEREHVHLLPDPALTVKPDHNAAAEILSEIRSQSFYDGLKIGVSVRDLSWQLDSGGVEAYLTAFQRCCDRLVDEFDARILFIPQCSYQHGSPGQDDRNVARQVTARMRHQDRAHVLGGQYRADAVMGLYRWLDVALTTRLHGAVFSATARTPFLAIAYLPKVHGFLRQVGMEEWSLAMPHIQDEEALFKKAAELIVRRQAVTERLNETVGNAEQRAREHFDIMSGLLCYPRAA